MTLSISTGQSAWILACVFLSICLPKGAGQAEHRLTNIHFYQLTTAEGLSDNYINCMAIDRTGFLWIGTGEGLSKFNGKSVEKYFKAEYPQLATDFTSEIVCDEQNRLWLMTWEGNITMIDEHRNFHAVIFYDRKNRVKVRKIIDSKTNGTMLLTRNYHLRLKDGLSFAKNDTLFSHHFDTIDLADISPIHDYSFQKVRKIGSDMYYYAGPENMYPVDYAALKAYERYPCPRCQALCEWENNSVLIYEIDNKVIKARNLDTNLETYPFENILDQYQRPISAYINEGYRITSDYYLFTTTDAGIYTYVPSTKSLINYSHNAADPTTIVNDMPTVITYDSTGWVFVGGIPNGISYFNRNAVIGQQVVFQDNQGRSYDGFIARIFTEDNDTYYLSSSDYLIEWKRSTNTSKFYSFSKPDQQDPIVNDVVTHVLADRYNHLWVIAKNLGIYVLDQKTKKTIHHIPLVKEGPDPFYTGTPLTLKLSHDGNIWATGTKGISIIDPKTFRVTPIVNTPLRELNGEYTFQVYFFNSTEAWFCTDKKGLWKFDFTTNEFTKYDTTSGLIHNEVYCMNKDRNGNVYVGTSRGLQIMMTNGKVLRYNEKNGLLNKRVEALLLDKKNRMWIGNDVGLCCFSIADTTMRAFDERYGLSIQGFRLNAYYQNSDDELFWGTERGIQYFYPDDLYNQNIRLRTIIHQIDSRDNDTYLTQNSKFTLSPGDNFVTFYFSTIEYSPHLHTFYQYQLAGLDPEWINVKDQNSARYTLLKPGVYTFKVRASNDKKTWFDAENEVTIELLAPFWGKAWFRWLAALILIALIYAIISRITKKQKARTEALETEAVVNYFASQINMHQHTDDLLWDVAKNCISRLNLEECVIYMVDEKRNVLVQKAAFGPKNPESTTILQPIEIPVGEGITGSVAFNKKPEIVNQTDKDPRYIVDDERRLSEIAVPIIIDGNVIGVIDSEHSQRNFFTQKHLSLMTTIAILTANQMQRIRAEEEKQKAEIEVLQNKQKATESRLQSLRLQMNPHFLFNALNSIQQMILANEEMVATKYLSRFSKLLRSILVHSDKEMISLKEELDILKLYVELESVRFKEAFSYEINCDVEIDCDEVKIPTLLVQPFVENAIWHGLMHKEGDRNLKIEFTEQGDILHCIIEDNGIGRQKAKEMRISTGQDKKHTSKGIEVSMERLKSLQKNGGTPGSLTIHDLVDAHGNPVGTRVEINLPIQN